MQEGAMNRARMLGTGIVVLLAGAGLGVASIYSPAGVAPVVDEVAASFMLAPVQAVAPEAAAEEEAGPRVIRTITGSASFYANSLAGRRTASGVRYNPREMVAAHPSLPFGSRLRVTNEANGKVVEVKVVDRGPYARGRVLDLSRVAAEKLDFIRRGHTMVTIEVLEDADDASDA
jgi:rare lipoprotein A